MPTPFDMVINNLKGLGFFEFLLPFLITSAVFYGLLRKSKIFGEPEKNVGVNAVVSLGAAFMVWASPIILGIDITNQFALFFLQGMIAMLVIMVIAMIATMFFGEDLPKQLSERFKGQGVWWLVLIVALLVGGGIFLSSGIISIFAPQGFSTFGGTDIGFIVLTIVMFIVFLVVIVLIAK
jgi:hypothetical protein